MLLLRKGGNGDMASKLRLENKVAIVTGGGSRAAGIGNGRAAVILFAREGAKVLIVDNKAGPAEETLAAVTKEGGEAEVFIGDVTSAADCRGMVERAVSRWKRLDILDNNVGIEGRATVVSVTEEDWDRVMAVNVKSMMLTGKYAVPAMAAGGGGSIINISSISALRPRGLTPYSTSKGAIIALTRAMAIDHAKDGIRVNCIAPGLVKTDFARALWDTPEAERRSSSGTPLRRLGEPDDIAGAAVFLAGKSGAWMTGQTVVVDGGATS